MRRKPEFSQSSLKILEDAKQIAINATAEQMDTLFDINKFPNISSAELMSWLIDESGLYNESYDSQDSKDQNSVLGGGTQAKSEDITIYPPHNHGYAAFMSLHNKIEEAEKKLAKDTNTIIAKLNLGNYSELTGVGMADVALKKACEVNNAAQVEGLLKAGADPTWDTIAQIASDQSLNKDTVAALIKNGVNSQIILDNLHTNNKDRDVIVAMVGIDQAIAQSFNSIKDSLHSTRLSDLKEAEITTLLVSAITQQTGNMPDQKDPFLKEFQQAITLGFVDELVADIKGLFSTQWRNEHIADTIKDQLKEVFDTTVKQEIAQTKSDESVKPGGFVEKLLAARNGPQHNGQER